jgi:hypothetical protein
MVFFVPLVAFAAVVGGTLALVRWSELNHAEKVRCERKFRSWVLRNYNRQLTTQAMAEQFMIEHPEAVEMFHQEYRLQSGY